MQIFESTEFSHLSRVPRALALGFFDGVHRGHQALLSAMQKTARLHNLRPAVLTFTESPADKFHKESFLGLIQTKSQRYYSLQTYGTEEIIALPMTSSVITLPPRAFLEEYIYQMLQAEVIIAGEDYSFGYRAQGKRELLQSFCQEKGIKLLLIPDLLFAGERISSSRIRQAIAAGEMELATAMLGHPFAHRAKVEKGLKLGRRLGFPTLNLQPNPTQVLPQFGVYRSQVLWQGQVCPAISNIGTAPTVHEGKSVKSESYILSTYHPSYGDEVEVQYLDFYRPEHNFSNLAELKAAVEADIIRAKNDFQIS